MRTMQTLRRAHHLARFVLVWFALSIGVAIASPLVKPQALELVCSGAGAIKLVKTDGDAKVSGHTLDCPLCAAVGAPPPAHLAQPVQARPLGHALLPLVSAHIAGRTAAPLPARGPPARA